jgi:SAM-dependent methyltransferase
MNLERALKIPGFTYDVELEWLARQASKRKCVVEVGCWKGRSTRAMADNMPEPNFLVAVDTWEGSAEDRHMEELKDKPDDWLEEQFRTNLEDLILEGRVIPVPHKSVDAARQFSYLPNLGWFGRSVEPDMIFIDGAHDYESVKADLLAWMPLLQPRGLLSGHDFDAGRPGVVKAVRELVPDAKMAGVGSIWYSGKLI